MSRIETSRVDGRVKGLPPGTEPMPLASLSRQGWNLLRGDLSLPVLVLKRSALEHNRGWMGRFLHATGVHLCPHGKTHMSPHLLDWQLADGAWGVTVANVRQLRVCHDVGVRRILLANQLIDPTGIRYVLDLLDSDPELDFYCLVDSLDAVDALASEIDSHPAPLPVLQVLVEAGLVGGRTGARTLEDLLEVARAAAAEPGLALRGVEAFEGVVSSAAPADAEARVRGLLELVTRIAGACAEEQLFAPGPVVLTAGGSAYFDLVAGGLGDADLGVDAQVVLRSGCYLTHDDHMYKDRFERLVGRSPGVRTLGPAFRPAIELWGAVQSCPEPGLAVLQFGKRDASFDAGFPIPKLWQRPASGGGVENLSGHSVTRLDDQHAYISRPAASPLRVGDRVGCGISHPCTTFDRWDVIPVVDDSYNVVSAIRTCF